jgi:hypothetical protein
MAGYGRSTIVDGNEVTGTQSGTINVNTGVRQFVITNPLPNPVLNSAAASFVGGDILLAFYFYSYIYPLSIDPSINYRWNWTRNKSFIIDKHRRTCMTIQFYIINNFIL